MMGWLLFRRDLLIAFRRGGGTWATLAFCLIVFAVFAFSLGPKALHDNAGRVLAVAVLLSCLVSLPGLFERDFDDGTLEQYLVQPLALEWLVLAKLLAFWLTAAVPLIVLAPLLSLMGGLSAADAGALALALLLATPTLSAMGAVGAALTLGLRRGGITQALIVLPLYIPPLIFTATVLENSTAYALLAGILLIAVPVSCLLSTALLRLTAD